MRANCPSCNTAYNVDDAKVPAGGARLKCAKCGTTFPIGGKSAAGGAVPLPGTAGAGKAIPLPGSVGAGAIPLPGNVGAAAIPLPGNVGAGGAAVPLPGNAAASRAGAAVPLPGGRASSGSAVPLPGSAGGAAVPLPSASTARAAAGAPVPLPGAARNVASDDFDAMLAHSDRTVAAPAPSSAALADDLGFDPMASSSDPGAGDDPFASDLAASSSAPYAADAGGDPFAADPGAGGEPFAADPGAGGDPYAAAPAASADPGAGDDPFAADFGAAPSAAPAADPGAGDDPFAMDFGGGGGAPQAPAASDGMEFDPTAPAPAAEASSGDGLEADLSAPSSPAAPAAPEGDDLELLDFIDDAEAQAKSKAKGGRTSKKSTFDGFMVRNRAGKSFGPMPEAEVVRMLAEGRLLGNEEISRDGESWQAFGAHGPFADALQKLMEAPGGLPTTGVAPAELGSAEATANLNVDVNERIKLIYGGRMAGIQIVDSRESVQKIKKRLPLFIGGGVAAVVAAFGIYLGFTPYGFFGVRKFFPKVIKEGSPLFARIVEGRKALGEGGYASLKMAQSSAEAVLAENDQFLDARALFALSTFAMKDRYGEAPVDALSRAHRYVEEMWVANPANPDAVASKAAEELLLGDAAALRPQLEKALTELTAKRPQGASEVALELGRSVAREDKAKAKTYFEKADGLGEVHLRALVAHATFAEVTLHENATAEALLAKAVKESPLNGPAALELARLRLGPVADPEHVEVLLTPLIAEPKSLSVEEQGRSHAYLGMVRVYQRRKLDAEAEFKQATALAPKSAAVEGAYAAYLLKRGAFEQAEPLFQDAVAQRPGDLQVTDGLVVAMLGNSHNLTAAKIVADADRKFANNAQVAVLQGAVAEADGRFDDAEKAYQLAITRDPKLTRADLALGRVDLKHDKLKEAHAALELALKKAPQDPDIATAWGEVALAEGRTDDALGIFDQALKIDNDAARTHLGRARALLAKKQLAEAQKEAETAVQQDEALSGNHRTLADVLFAEGEWQKAREAYLLAIKQDSKDDTAYLQLGRSLFNLGDYDAAQVAFDNAKTINRGSYQPYFWLAQAHFKKHELTQAIEAMNRAMDNGGQSDPEVHYQFGLVYGQADGHYNDALDEFKTALKMRPSYEEVLEALGDAVFAAEDPKKAVEYYEQAFALEPKRVALLAKVGNGYFKSAQYQKAIDAYQRHLKADPAAPNEQYQIGAAYDGMGKKKEAIAAYKESTLHDVANAKAWESLGYDYKDLGKNKEAAGAFRQYLKLNPKAEDRKEIESELEGMSGGGE
jgi:predicted Zn finger-like uncharacterized protein